MNAVDARARRASAAIHESLAMAAPPAAFATVVRRAAVAKVVNLALVGAGAAIFIAAGAAFRTPQPQIPVAEPVTTTTSEAPAPSTTIPNGEAPLVVALPTTTEPVATTSAAPPTTVAPTTTTSTSEAPPTTTTSKPPPTTTKPPDITPPVIDITFPENRQRFAEPGITIKGTTEPGATVTLGERKADLGDAGQWRIRVELEPGRNRFVVVATDAAGNSARSAVVVLYDAPELEPFTAHATFGSCELDPPYDVYYGRGEPGSAISVSSEFGSGATTVGLDGGWEVKVFFPEAPPGKVFPVTVADEFGRSKTFEFVSNVPK